MRRRRTTTANYGASFRSGPGNALFRLQRAGRGPHPNDIDPSLWTAALASHGPTAHYLRDRRRTRACTQANVDRRTTEVRAEPRRIARSDGGGPRRQFAFGAIAGRAGGYR